MKNLLNLKMLVVVMLSALFVSCSQEENLATDKTPENLVYKMEFNCPAPSFDGSGTRASSTSWTDGSVVYLKFKNGSSYIYGTATYSSSSSSWTIQAQSTIPSTSTATEVEACYISNAKSVSGNTVTMTDESVVYKSTGTYTASSSTIYVTVTMNPYVGRLRFKGTNGTILLLSSSDNDMLYYSSFNSSNFTFNTSTVDETLTVGSDGYTDYIYGTFGTTSGNKKITVTTDATYCREDIPASSLANASSACLTVPTSSNYSSLGWTKNAADLTVTPDILTVISCGAASNFSYDSNVYSYYAGIFNSSLLNGMSQTEKINYLKTNGARFSHDQLNYQLRSDLVDANTNMTLLTLGVAENGTEGNLYSKEFTTPTDANQPEVTISNISISGNKASYDCNMNSYCSRYYITAFSDASEHILFAAWVIDYRINNGTASLFSESTRITTTFSSESSITECAVFARGVSSSGTLSNVVNSATYGGSNARRYKLVKYPQGQIANLLEKGYDILNSPFK